MILNPAFGTTMNVRSAWRQGTRSSQCEILAAFLKLLRLVQSQTLVAEPTEEIPQSGQGQSQESRAFKCQEECSCWQHSEVRYGCIVTF